MAERERGRERELTSSDASSSAPQSRLRWGRAPCGTTGRRHWQEHRAWPADGRAACRRLEKVEYEKAERRERQRETKDNTGRACDMLVMKERETEGRYADEGEKERDQRERGTESPDLPHPLSPDLSPHVSSPSKQQMDSTHPSSASRHQ